MNSTRMAVDTSPGKWLTMSVDMSASFAESGGKRLRFSAERVVRQGRSRGPYWRMALEHDERPWGSYEVLVDAADHKVKQILVKPGKRLSLQKHARRSEHWFVVRGSGVVTLNDAPVAVEPGTAVDIGLGATHRIENTGTDDLVFVEVQHGDYFGEDDIVRLEDDFGRAG